MMAAVAAAKIETSVVVTAVTFAVVIAPLAETEVEPNPNHSPCPSWPKTNPQLPFYATLHPSLGDVGVAYPPKFCAKLFLLYELKSALILNII